MRELTIAGIPRAASSVPEPRPLRHRAGIAVTLLFALATGSSLVACGTEVLDERADGTSGGGLVGDGLVTVADAGAGEVLHPTMVSAGLMHACAVTAAGAVKCWGSNLCGALGDGSGTDSDVPVEVVGLSSGARAVAVGDSYACAITGAGGVECWGRNLTGSLGNDATIDSPVPVDVVGLSTGVVAISAGSDQTCAVTAAGALVCWGWNANGQLGDGSTTDSHVPVGVVGLSTGVVAVSAGGNHTCALTSAGAVKCWGDNHQGQLGGGPKTESHVPVDVVGLSPGVVALAAGSEHTCAVTAAGALRCWGWNALGQIGNGATSSSAFPVDVFGLPPGVVAVSGGVLHTCAVTGAGAVHCWGGNFLGQLGDGSAPDSFAPVEVKGLPSGVVAVSAGSGHTCVRTGAGAVACWGPDYDVGAPDGSFSTVPVVVPGL
jgi:alpha-tubulin suppressor-like RCC1 family protein